MTGRNSLHYCYDVSYQCWFASEEAKIYCDNFNNSNAVVCSHLIFAYTARLAIINAIELERNGWLFFTFIEECCVVIEKNIDQKLANKISHQIWYKGRLKGKFGGGVHIRCDTGTTYWVIWSTTSYPRNPRVQVNCVSFRLFWPRYGKKCNSYWYVLNI